MFSSGWSQDEFKTKQAKQERQIQDFREKTQTGLK